MKMTDAKIRFWSKVEKRSDSECWNWTAGKFETGYGAFHYLGKNCKASRIAWLFSNGEFDESLFVCHRCDNPSCCNPNHLFLGTPKDNTNDCKIKGRRNTSMGQNHYRAKFTNDQVEKMKSLRKDGLLYRQIAGFFNANEECVRRVVIGERWKHLNQPPII